MITKIGATLDPVTGCITIVGKGDPFPDEGLTIASFNVVSEERTLHNVLLGIDLTEVDKARVAFEAVIKTVGTFYSFLGLDPVIDLTTNNEPCKVLGLVPVEYATFSG